MLPQVLLHVRRHILNRARQDRAEVTAEIAVSAVVAIPIPRLGVAAREQRPVPSCVDDGDGEQLHGLGHHTEHDRTAGADQIGPSYISVPERQLDLATTNGEQLGVTVALARLEPFVASGHQQRHADQCVRQVLDPVMEQTRVAQEVKVTMIMQQFLLEVVLAPAAR